MKKTIFRVMSLLLALCGIADVVFSIHYLASGPKIPAAAASPFAIAAFAVLFLAGLASIAAGALELAGKSPKLSAILCAAAAVLTFVSICFTQLTSRLNAVLLCVGMILTLSYLLLLSLRDDRPLGQPRRAAGIVLLVWSAAAAYAAYTCVLSIRANLSFLQSMNAALEGAADTPAVWQYYVLLIAPALLELAAGVFCLLPKSRGSVPAILCALGAVGGLLGLIFLGNCWLLFAPSLALCLLAIPVVLRGGKEPAASADSQGERS